MVVSEIYVDSIEKNIFKTLLKEKNEEISRLKTQIQENKIYSVHVGNLRFSTKKHEIFDHFRRCGTIKRIKVHSKFATIEFDQESDYRRALTLDGIDYQGKYLKVVPNQLKNDQSPYSVYVGNLRNWTTRRDLMRLFSHCGFIKTIFLGNHFATLEFKKEKHYLNALALNETFLNGKCLQVVPYERKMTPKEDDIEQQKTEEIIHEEIPSDCSESYLEFIKLIENFIQTNFVKRTSGEEISSVEEVKSSKEEDIKTEDSYPYSVYVGKLSPSTNKEDLLALFKNCGSLLLGPNFATLGFSDKVDYENALNLNKILFHDKNLKVVPDQRKMKKKETNEDGIPPFSIYVGNLDLSTTRKEVADHFKDCEGIKELFVGDKFATIEFETLGQFYKGMSLHWTYIKGNRIKVVPNIRKSS